MFLQLFRNKIYENRKLKYQIRKLESFIGLNLSQPEPDIVKGLARLWNSQASIRLQPFQLGRTFYHLYVEFYQLVTHGPPYVTVNDKISIDSGDIEYKTEYGDLAFIVDYWLEEELLSRKISILQSKKEKSKDKVDIKLHQQYLMQFWPDVVIAPKSKNALSLKFPEANPDEFSFYHFILNHHKGSLYSSSVCSAPFVGSALNITLQGIRKPLVNWCKRKQTNPRLQPPSQPLSIPLLPGKIYQHGKYYKWNLLTKPFTRFILDAAYLFVGTAQRSVLNVAFAKVPNILAMKVVGGREGKEFRNRFTDIYEFRKEKNSGRDEFIFW